MLEGLIKGILPGQHLHFRECKKDPCHVKKAWETDRDLNLLCNLLKPRQELENFCEGPLRNVIILMQEYIASDFMPCTDSFFNSATGVEPETMSLLEKYVADLPKYAAAVLYVNDVKFWKWSRECNPYQDFLIRLSAISKAASGQILILDNCTRVKHGFKETLSHIGNRIQYIKIS